MPGPDWDNDSDLIDYLSNQENLIVDPIPGMPNPNPGYDSDLGGRRINLPDSNKRVLLVKRREGKDLGPNLSTVDNAQEAPGTSLDVPGDIANVIFDRSKPLTAYAEVDSWTLANIPPALGVSPLAAVAGGAPPVGGAVSVIVLEYGHKGTQLQMLFDCPAGQVTKATVIASSARMKVRLLPKYYASQVLAGKRQYYYNAGFTVPCDFNNFNLPPNNPMTLAGFTNANAFKSRGMICEGSLSTNNEFTLPKRRFYGTVLGGAIANQPSNCPVAWNSTAVILVGGGVTAAFAALTLKFTVNTIQGQTLGPFPLNTPIVLPQGAVSIDVYNDAVTAAVEIPFELQYILG